MLQLPFVKNCYFTKFQILNLSLPSSPFVNHKIKQITIFFFNIDNIIKIVLVGYTFLKTLQNDRHEKF